MAAFSVDVSDPPFALPADNRGRMKKPIDHVCKLCGLQFQSRNPRQFYCEPCSESQDLKRKRLTTSKSHTVRRRDERRDVGRKISATEARSLADPRHQPVFCWYVKVCVPFSWSASKNAIYSLQAKGHVALRRESRNYRDALTLVLKSALRDRKIVQNKLWIDIFVEKASHRGDAVNMVDTVCDAVKVAANLDDRWFCIRQLDWSINKDDPQLIVGVGQEKIEASQACSYCGRIQPFANFGSNKNNKDGHSRICRDCSKKPRGQSVQFQGKRYDLG